MSDNHPIVEARQVWTSRENGSPVFLVGFGGKEQELIHYTYVRTDSVLPGIGVEPAEWFLSHYRFEACDMDEWYEQVLDRRQLEQTVRNFIDGDLDSIELTPEVEAVFDAMVGPDQNGSASANEADDSLGDESDNHTTNSEKED